MGKNVINSTICNVNRNLFHFQQISGKDYQIQKIKKDFPRRILLEHREWEGNIGPCNNYSERQTLSTPLQPPSESKKTVTIFTSMHRIAVHKEESPANKSFGKGGRMENSWCSVGRMSLFNTSWQHVASHLWRHSFQGKIFTSVLQPTTRDQLGTVRCVLCRFALRTSIRGWNRESDTFPSGADTRSVLD